MEINRVRYYRKDQFDRIRASTLTVRQPEQCEKDRAVISSDSFLGMGTPGHGIGMHNLPGQKGREAVTTQSTPPLDSIWASQNNSSLATETCGRPPALLVTQPEHRVVSPGTNPDIPGNQSLATTTVMTEASVPDPAGGGESLAERMVRLMNSTGSQGLTPFGGTGGQQSERRSGRKPISTTPASWENSRAGSRAANLKAQGNLTASKWAAQPALPATTPQWAATKIDTKGKGVIRRAPSPASSTDSSEL